MVSGVALLSPALQLRLSALAAPLATRASAASTRAGAGLAGQCVVGALLGAVWSPCVGPTLGSAIGLAASGGSLLEATGVMALFGVGSAAPLLAIAYAARRIPAARHRIMRVATRARTLFGASLAGIGLLVMTGLDRRVEAAMLDALPMWWIDLLASV